MLGHLPWAPGPMYTFHSLHSSPIRHEVDLSSSGGDGRGGERTVEGGGREEGQDQTCLLGRAPLPPSPQAGLFGELSTHQDA